MPHGNRVYKTRFLRGLHVCIWLWRGWTRGNWVLETRFQIWKLSLKDSVSNRYILKLTPQTPHSLTHRLCHTDQVSSSPSHASAHLSLTLFSHSVITLLTSPITHPLRRSSSLTHPFLLLCQTFTTSLIILFTNHPLSLTLFSHSVKHSSLHQSPSSLTQSIWHSSPSTKDLIKHSEVYRGLIITLWFQFVFFYFRFCFEFLIELLKKIEALLFFEIGLCLWVSRFVYICYGIELCFLVCLYLLRI